MKSKQPHLYVTSLAVSFVICLVALAGCNDKSAKDAAYKLQEEKVEAITKLLAEPPKETVFQTSRGEVLMLDLPMTRDFSSIETQRCFVFISKDTGQSNMTCPHQPTEEYFIVDDSGAVEH